MEKPTRVRGLIVDNISPRHETVQIRLALKDKSDGVILNLRDDLVPSQ